MRIKRLELKNFRGFEELTINFPEDSNVAIFVGVNGAGKTSVLEGCLPLLNFWYDWLTFYKQKIFYDKDDVKKGSDSTINSLEIKYYSGIIKIEGGWGINNEKKLNSILGMKSSEKSGYYSIEKEPYKEELIPVYKNIDYRRVNLLSYYSTDRIVSRSPNLKIKDISNIDYKEALEDAFEKTTNFDSFFEWFRNIEDYENEQRLYEKSDFRDKSLQSVRKSINIFLPNFNNPRVQRQPQEELIVEKNGEKLSISNLSHGERLMFAMVGDIARRLSIANPGLDDPLQGEGVVLVDEIELHLHPGWQRKIVPLLTKTFPNIQLILTTHSPQVISSVERESVFILEDFKLVEKTPHTFGRDSNSILQDLFNVTERPDEVKKEFRKLYRLMDKPEETETTKHLLKEMEEKYGADDPEIMRAKMHLEFLNEE